MVFGGIIIGDIFLSCILAGCIQDFLEMFKAFLKMFMGISVNWEDVIFVVVLFMVTWLEVVLMALLAITLSTTLFANKRYKGVISFG